MGGDGVKRDVVTKRKRQEDDGKEVGKSERGEVMTKKKGSGREEEEMAMNKFDKFK